MGRLFRQLIVPLVLLGVGIGVALLFQQSRALLAILVLFPRWTIVLIVGLILLAEVVKITRWRYFVRAAGIPMRWRDAATSLLAGQTASTIHGGDLLRVRLAAEHGIPPRTGLTVSFAMWATDVMCLPLLALAGFGKHLIARWLLFLPLTISVILMLVVRSRRFARFVSRLLRRYRLTRRYALEEEEIEHITRLLTRRSVIGAGILYAAVMRMLFAVTLWCIVAEINYRPIRYDALLSASALSALAGAVPFMPGLVAVGSLIELLNLYGVSRVLGFLITLTNRLINVAVNLTLGVVVLLWRYRHVLVHPRDSAVEEPSELVTASSRSDKSLAVGGRR